MTAADRVEAYLDERARRGHRADVIGTMHAPRRSDPEVLTEADLRALIAEARR